MSALSQKLTRTEATGRRSSIGRRRYFVVDSNEEYVVLIRDIFRCRDSVQIAHDVEGACADHARTPALERKHLLKACVTERAAILPQDIAKPWGSSPQPTS